MTSRKPPDHGIVAWRREASIALGQDELGRRRRPTGAALAPDGSLCVATDCAVLRIADSRAEEPVIETIAGSPDGCGVPADGSGRLARFGGLGQVAVDADGSVVVADRGAHAIRRVALQDDEAVVSTIAGKLGASGNVDGPAAIARFHSPAAVALMPGGGILVTDAGNAAVRVIDGDRVGTVARSGAVRALEGIAVDRITDAVYVTDATGVWWVADPGWCASPGSSHTGARDGTIARARFDGPRALVVHPGGMLMVADTGNDRLRLASRWAWGWW